MRLSRRLVTRSAASRACRRAGLRWHQRFLGSVVGGLPCRATSSLLHPRLQQRAARRPHSLSQRWVSGSPLSSGSGVTYAERMLQAWKKDPSSVHASWAAYFEGLEAGLPEAQAFQSPGSAPAVASGGGGIAAQDDLDDHFRLSLLIHAYQTQGVFAAKLDPLNLNPPQDPPQLDYKYWGFTEEDLDMSFNLGNITQVSGFLRGQTGGTTLREILGRLRETYCGTLGVEYTHIQEPDQLEWLQQRIETPQQWSFPVEEKKVILDRLIWADSFERFIHKKFATAKRFGLDGGESMIPSMKCIIDTAAEVGVKDIVIGMPHRGRLNVLSTVVRKPLETLFKEFRGELPSMSKTSGDVKYHLGTSYTRPTRTSDHREIALSLLANPSHLEAVDPVVLGKVRAKQFFNEDRERKTAMAILLHGDASFAGQGVVYECFDFTDCVGYTTGGTVHIVVNNQIGFTTDPRDSRSSPFCTAVAKTVGAPIFHVNGDDPEAVVWASKLATEFRHTFGKDAVIDLVCYRRFGHNEIDQPRFTQPLMYQVIDKHPRSVEIYKDKLVKEGSITEEEYESMVNTTFEFLEEAFQSSKEGQYEQRDCFSTKWDGFHGPAQLSRIKGTGVPLDVLRKVGEVLYGVKDGFNMHKLLAKQLRAREKMFTEDAPLDWAAGELMAYGTLLAEGFVVRLSGQDVERGTFSHRHATYTDQKTGEKWTPLHSLGRFRAQNSSLSEFAVLGFELGYSLEDPNNLVIWEAQFGDFANGAQIIIDQFISCGEEKWLRQSGLVLLLPHGYDGQGPEHSSGRPERFLQLSNSDPLTIPDFSQTENYGHTLQIQQANMQIVNVTTPANYFHVLRRQLHRTFRKPLIVFTPKALLRHQLCTSPLSDFQDDNPTSTRFQRVIGESYPDEIDSPDAIKNLIFCTGKVYYEMLIKRREENITDSALVRVEQLAPFPWDRCGEELAKYPNAQVRWVQEEPMNMGYWTFLRPHFDTLMAEQERRIAYIGRPTSSSPATGWFKVHQQEQADLLERAFAQ